MGLLRAQEITDIECTCFNYPKIGDISRSLNEKKVKFKKKYAQRLMRGAIFGFIMIRIADNARLM